MSDSPPSTYPPSPIKNKEIPAPSQPALAKSRLEEYERDGDHRPVFILTYTEVKLLGIAGVRYRRILLFFVA